jgi:hypothetical protein
MAYNLLNPVVAINAASMATSLTSSVVEIKEQDNVGVQLDFSGAPVGTFECQVSMNYAQDAIGNVTNAGNWIPVDLTGTPTAAGAADHIYIDLNQLSAPYIRVVYTRTSGTGSLTCRINGKAV